MAEPKVIDYVHLELVDRAKNHDKFYNIFRYNNNAIVTVYGRNGTVGHQTDPQFCGTEYSAVQLFEDLQRKKTSKGYIIKSGATHGWTKNPPSTPDWYGTTPVPDKKEKAEPKVLSFETTEDPVIAKMVQEILNRPEVIKKVKKEKSLASDVLPEIMEEIRAIGLDADEAFVTTIIAKVLDALFAKQYKKLAKIHDKMDIMDSMDSYYNKYSITNPKKVLKVVKRGYSI